MATQRKGSKGLCCVSGVFRRIQAKHENSADKIAPKKFLLGRDKRKADVANAKLELLWPFVLQRQGNAQKGLLGAPPTAMEEPIWDGHELEIAEAIRSHKHLFVIEPQDESVHTDAGYAEATDAL